MFTWLRSIMKPVFWVVVISFVGFIFFAWGKQSDIAGEMSVAIIDGEPIAEQEYRVALNDALERARENGELTPAEEGKLRRDVLEQMIRRLVLLREAEAMGLAVSDEELLQYLLLSEPAFRDEQGRPDRGRYEQFRTTQPARVLQSLERYKREQLLFAKLSDGITSNLRVSLSDLTNYYRTYYRRYELAQVLVRPESFVSEERVRAFYEQNKDTYVQPLRVHARHILIAAPRGSEAEVFSKARLRAENLREEIAAGRLDFAAAAKQYSADTTSAVKGGDLGVFGTGQMVAPFEGAAFALRPGEMSAVVQTDFGFHIIEVLARLENEPWPYDKLRDGLRRRLVGDAERQQAKARAEAALAELNSGTAFAAVARKYSDAGSAARGGALGTLARFMDPLLFDQEEYVWLDKELVNNSFIITPVSERLDTLAPGTHSGIITSPFGYHLVRVGAVSEADETHFAEFRGQVERELSNRLQQDIFNRWYAARRAAYDIEIKLTEAELNPQNGNLAPLQSRSAGQQAPQF